MWARTFLLGGEADMAVATASAPTDISATFRRALPWLLTVLVVIAIVISYGWKPNDTEAVMARTVRAAGPLMLGALCGLISERSGIVNIGIEGQMLLAAYCGFMASSYTADSGTLISLLLGVGAGMAAAALAGAFMGWCAIGLKMDQIIAGTVVNIFAAGFTSYAYVQGRTQPSFPSWSVPGVSEIPVVGKMFDQGPLTYVAFLAIIAVHIALFRTRWGLRTRAVGEHPSAVDTVGVSVLRLRYINMTIAGGLAGLAGMALIQSASVFNRGMTNGAGFIALAVMLFGRYRPFGVLVGALLLGFFNGLQSQLQFRSAFDIPPQFFGMIPFVLTIVVLAVSGLAARPPAAAGTPYETE